MQRHARALLLLSTSALLGGYVACSGDEPGDATAPDGGTATDGSSPTSADGTPGPIDSALDGPSPEDTGAPTDGGADAADADATDEDATDEDAGDANAGEGGTDAGDSGTDAGDSGSDAGDAGDSGTGPQMISPANCPSAVFVHGSTIYWSESNQPILCPGQTITVGIRSAPLTGSTVLPPQIYVGGAGTSHPTGIIVLDLMGKDTLFFADNTAAHANLWRLEPDGGSTAWGPTGTFGPTSVVANATHFFWTASAGAYRTEIATPGGAAQLEGNTGGGTVHGIAIDADTTYAIRFNGATGVYACDHTKLCTAAGGSTPGTIALATNLLAIGADGVDVYFTGGDPAFTAPTTTEKLYRCPKAGCAGQTPVDFATTTTTVNGNANHEAIAVDATHVYWSTIAGKIYRCRKAGASCALPEMIASGVRPASFAQDEKNLYWADRRGGIYRIAKP